MKFKIIILFFVFFVSYACADDSAGLVDFGPLQRLAGSGQEDKLKSLIESDYKSTLKNAKGIITYSFNAKIASLLASYGANVMDCNKFGWNILMMGCSNKDIDLVKFALANKLDVNSKDLVGHTPLSFCAANQSTEIAQLIIKSGAYVNEQDSQGRSILALAAQEGNLELVVLLLQCNADPRIPDCENKLPSDYAKMAPEDFVNKETYKKIEDLLNNAVKSYETKK